jgi:hypothetical protein
VGREVAVFVERVSRDAGSPADSAQPLNAFGVEVRWNVRAAGRNGEAPGASAAAQVSGRTPGDLIVVFDAPPGLPAGDLVGRIVPVRLRGCGPLILKGVMAGQEV